MIDRTELTGNESGYEGLHQGLVAAYRQSGDGWRVVELARDLMREAYRDRGRSGIIDLSRKPTPQVKSALDNLDGDVRGRLLSLAKNEPLREGSIEGLREYFSEHFAQAEAAVRCILGAHIEASRSAA